MRDASRVRLFIALWPPQAVREQIVAWQAQWQWPPKASVVAPERLHLTLHFLGDVAPERIRDLGYVLEPIRAQHFALHFVRSENWKDGVVVMRPEHVPTQLRGLHGRIGLALSGIGMAPEPRPYRAHVTLARRADGAVPPPGPADVHWSVQDGFVLVRVHGGTRGYEVIGRYGA